MKRYSHSACLLTLDMPGTVMIGPLPYLLLLASVCLSNALIYQPLIHGILSIPLSLLTPTTRDSHRYRSLLSHSPSRCQIPLLNPPPVSPFHSLS